jgi:glycosyltransferase involved in cell wall biosynthesis
MRILQIGPLPPEVGGQTPGGIASHVWDLARRLAQRGHKVGVLAYNVALSRGDPVTRDGVEIYGRARLSHWPQIAALLNPCFLRSVIHAKKHFRSLANWRGTIRGLLDAGRAIHMFKPEAIHVHQLEPRYPFTYFAAEGKNPITTTVHSTHYIDFGPQSEREVRHQFIRRILDLAPNLLFVSHFVKKRYETLFPGMLADCRTEVIPNPLDSSFFHPIQKEAARQRLGVLPTEPLVLFVGSLIPRKGVPLLLEAAGRLKSKGVPFRLAIVGDGPQRNELENLIIAGGLGRLVSLEGPKLGEELLYYYNAADVFALPSYMESFGLVFVEAMLCGCPVVGTPDVISELIPSDDYGYYVPVGDPEALAVALEEALQRQWDREQIREYACTFDWERMIGKYEAVYEYLK